MGPIRMPHPDAAAARVEQRAVGWAPVVTWGPAVRSRNVQVWIHPTCAKVVAIIAWISHGDHLLPGEILDEPARREASEDCPLCAVEGLEQHLETIVRFLKGFAQPTKAVTAHADERGALLACEKKRVSAEDAEQLPTLARTRGQVTWEKRSGSRREAAGVRTSESVR